MSGLGSVIGFFVLVAGLLVGGWFLIEQIRRRRRHKKLANATKEGRSGSR